VAAAANAVKTQPAGSTETIYDAEFIAKFNDDAAAEMSGKIFAMRHAYLYHEELTPLWDELDAVVARHRAKFQRVIATEKAKRESPD
jgi:hypothetical protein